MRLHHGLLAAIAGLLALAPALAMAHDHDRHRGPRVSVDLHFGAPGYYGPHYGYGHPYYWYGPHYYGPRWIFEPRYFFYDEVPVVREYNVTRIIEPPAAPAAPPPAQNWYLCEDSGYYYPYVTECASGWKVVPATPPR